MTGVLNLFVLARIFYGSVIMVLRFVKATHRLVTLIKVKKELVK